MARARSARTVGRQDESALLRGLVQKVSGGDSATVYIVGEAGVGKTRMVSDCVAELQASGGLVLMSHGVALEGGALPYGGVVELLRDAERQLGRDLLRVAAGRAAGPLVGLLPAFANSTAVGAVDRVEVVSAVLELLETLTTGQIVCWVVEDLQWVDAVTRDTFRYISRVISDRRLLLLATIRTEGEILPDLFEDLERDSSVELVRLHRLADHESTALLGHLVAEAGRGPLDDREADRIVRLADGVPFYVEQLAESVSGRLPPNVRRLQTRVLDRLGPGERELVGAAAIGRPALRHDLLLAVLDTSEADLDARLQGCVGAGVLEPTGRAGSFTFRHALLAEAAAEELLPRTVAHWHAAWADALERFQAPEDERARALAVARHRFAAAHDEVALGAVVRAARAAEELDVYEEAATRWQQVFDMLESLPTPPGLSREDALVRWLTCLTVGPGHHTMFSVIDRIRATSWARSRWMVDLWLRAVEALFSRDDRPPLVEEADVAGTLARVMAQPVHDLSMNLLHRLLHLWERAHPEIRPVLHSRLEQMNAELGDTMLDIENLRHRAWEAGRLGDGDSMLDYFHREAAITAHGNLTHRTYAALDLSYALVVLGRAAEALAVTTPLMASAPRNPSELSAIWPYLAGSHALALCETGRWDEAVTVTRAVLDQVDDRFGTGDVRVVDARIHARRGELDRARKGLDHAGTPSGAFDFLWTYLQPHLEVATGAGDLVEARRVVKEMWAHPYVHDAFDVVQVAVLGAARALLGGSDPQSQDAELIRDKTGLAAPLGAAGRACHAEVALLLDRVECQDDPDRWAEVVSVWDECGQPFDAALCRVRQAESLLREGRLAEAEAPLSRAWKDAEPLGAIPVMREINALARAAGVRISHASRTGRPSDGPLTARENEVLTLVAAGSTNEQIAATLFMSPKTASVHVSRILAKLDVTNRTQAAAVARRLNILPPKEPPT